ncbi:MAG: hypothetical protein LC104_01670 [Bacteroidales bacterium]|nr:hypothetical protein [Bacteroidales bacterium]
MIPAAETHPFLETQPVAERTLEDRLAPILFTIAFVDILLMAGFLHRVGSSNVQPLEIDIMRVGLMIAWPLIALDGVVAFFRRSPDVSWKLATVRVLLILVLPSARIAWVHPVTNQIWLPRLGWQSPGKPLFLRLEKLFGVPMFIFAFLILPVLGAEYLLPERVKEIPALMLVLDVGIAMIWVAFLVEFLVKASAAPKTLAYVKERWLDMAIVLLPTLEFILTRWVDAAPLARLLRLGRVIAPEQIAKMNKLYRLRGLMMKGWYAFLLLGGMARITGNSAEKRLLRLEVQIAELEEQLAELQQEADELRKQLANASGNAGTPVVG